MIITILNGNMQPEPNGFSIYVSDLTRRLQKDHTVNHFQLREMSISHCTGCWACWWKTPGICAIKDDMDRIFATIMASEFLIFASPIMRGFTSSLLKRMTDRLVTLLHPYIILNNGECHHRKRYERYPDFGLLLEKEHDTDNEDIEIIRDIYDRFALNFHCKQRIVWLTDLHKTNEIAYDTNNI